MRRIDNEAQALLLHRRQALARAGSHAHAVEEAGHDDEAGPAFRSDQVKRELAQIDEALLRIASGSYGTCLACGGPLGMQRIRAIPEARYCLGCSGQRRADD